MSYRLPRGDHNYNFVDMVGRRVGRLVVVRRATNVCGNARWLCRCDCGREWTVEGIRLRAVERQGRVDYSCPDCRRSRPGTVRRRPKP